MSYKIKSPKIVAEGGTGSQSLTGILTGNGTSAVTASAVTQYGTIIAGASNAVASVAPSATSGVPIISQGSSSNPAYGTMVVAGGGTGITSATAYAVLCGGTTSTGALQSISGVGDVGQVLTSADASALPSFQDAAVSSGGSTIVTSYTTGSGNHVLDADTKMVSVYLFGGGAGGGSGRRGTSASSGGGGAGGSTCAFNNMIPVGYFGGAGATVAYAVGGGGTGGAAQSSNDSNGNPGGVGSVSTFGNLTTLQAPIGGQGAAGGGSSGSSKTWSQGYGTSGGPNFMNGANGSAGNGGSSDRVTNVISLTLVGSGVGGGGGGGNTVTPGTGGNAGAILSIDGSTIIAGVSGGTIAGQSGSNGNPGMTSAAIFMGGTGGGGGAGGTNILAAGAGGNGAAPGGSGGGGGGSVNGANSGKGGDGATGGIYIFEYL